MLSPEQIRQADDFPRPEDGVLSLLSEDKDVRERFFIKFFENVKSSDLMDEQKIHLYVWILYCACFNALEQTKTEVASFLTLPDNLKQVAFYLLNFVDAPDAPVLQWNMQKYIANRGPILTAMGLIRDNVKSLPSGKLRREIIHRYNQLVRCSF